MSRLLTRSVLIAAALSTSSTLPVWAQSTAESAAQPASQPASQPATQPGSEAEGHLPVRSVTLFSSGVGYFEHTGQVTGDDTTALQFKSDQINDVLKSLVLQDLDGGTIATVQYPSQDPVDKRLKSFRVDITADPPLADLLKQLRGAQVTVNVANEQYAGTVLGVEKRAVPGGKDNPPVDAWFVNLITGPLIRQVELNRISNIKLDDPALQRDLARALEALSQSRDQDKKQVTLNFRGKGDRRIRIGYVVESPVWKTSYRLILNKDHTGLQGWAIVENQTDNDWNNVQLSLVSGRPISFRMNLYQPIYLPRPMVALDLLQNLMPQTYAGGVAGDIANLAKAASPAPSSASRGRRDGKLFGDSPDAEAQMDAESSVRALASGAKLGELFQYTVGNVSIPRQTSAMIPIVTDKVKSEKLSIYNRRVLTDHPLNGVLLTNSTDKHLLQGPITVFESGGYAGDATITNLPPGQQRLLSYGVDLDVTVRPDDKSELTLEGGKIVKGVLHLQRKQATVQRYRLESKADTDKTVVVEEPVVADAKLVDTPKPFEQTTDLYRFKVPLPKGQATTFTVRQERVVASEVALLEIDQTALVQLSREGELPQKVRDALADVAHRRQTLSDLDARLEQIRQQIKSITGEQSRIRENMKTVDRNSAYYNRLLAKLDDQESQLEKLAVQEDDTQKQINTAQQAFDAAVNGMSIE